MALSAVQSIAGIVQGVTNKEPDRPEYKIPQEVHAMLNQMQQRTREGLPGKQMMEERLFSQGAGLSTQLREAAPSGAMLQGSISGLAGDIMEGLKDIELMDAQFKDSARVDYGRALMEMAEYKDRQWDFNVNQPYVQQLTEYYNKKAASQENILGGLSSMAKYGFLSSSDTDNDLFKRNENRIKEETSGPDIYQDTGIGTA